MTSEMTNFIPDVRHAAAANPLSTWCEWMSGVSSFWMGAVGDLDDHRTAADDSHFTEGGFDGIAYMLYVPISRPARSLVLMLHGCGQRPIDFAQGTAMNEAASKAGFAVLYPAQTPSANCQGCWNWHLPLHQARGTGEPALLAALTAQVATQCAIDPCRIYVAGLSAGGAMAAILGETYPDLFAAVGVHSGIPTRCATDIGSALRAMNGRSDAPATTSGGVPMIVFHGDSDRTVHSSNGEQLAMGRAGAGAVLTRKSVVEGGRRSTRTVHRNSDGAVLSEHWCVHGAAHQWSGGDASGSYADHLGPNASTKMLRFFRQHARTRS